MSLVSSRFGGSKFGVPRRKPFRSNEGLCPDSNRGESGKVEKFDWLLEARCLLLVAACPNVLARAGGVAVDSMFESLMYG